MRRTQSNGSVETRIAVDTLTTGSAHDDTIFMCQASLRGKQTRKIDSTHFPDEKWLFLRIRVPELNNAGAAGRVKAERVATSHWSSAIRRVAQAPCPARASSPRGHVERRLGRTTPAWRTWLRGSLRGTIIDQGRVVGPTIFLLSLQGYVC